MSSTATQRTPTYEDFLRLQRTPEATYEWIDGELIAMAGATRVHARLSTRLSALFDSALQGRPCVAQNADQRVWVDAHNVFLPDLSVTCPPFQAPDTDPQAVSNPTMILEILSPSTAAFDREDKFRLYRRVPSLRHYVLVAQDAWYVEHFQRQADDRWELNVAGPGDLLRMDDLGVTLSVDAIYAGVEDLGGPSRDTVPRIRTPGLRVVRVEDLS